MGGTEIGSALKVAYAATTGSESADLFIVTDGEVSEWSGVVADAKRSGRRIFTVGVGTRSEAFVRDWPRRPAAGVSRCRAGMADRVIRPERTGAAREAGRYPLA
jgi:hypothetical protein